MAISAKSQTGQGDLQFAHPEACEQDIICLKATCSRTTGKQSIRKQGLAPCLPPTIWQQPQQRGACDLPITETRKAYRCGEGQAQQR